MDEPLARFAPIPLPDAPSDQVADHHLPFGLGILGMPGLFVRSSTGNDPLCKHACAWEFTLKSFLNESKQDFYSHPSSISIPSQILPFKPYIHSNPIHNHRLSNFNQIQNSFLNLQTINIHSKTNHHQSSSISFFFHLTHSKRPIVESKTPDDYKGENKDD